MHRGEMVVKTVQRGKFVDVPIKEGEMFLLPGRIPHSPQRFKDTVGLVIERERDNKELDCLRWYIPNQETPEPLYEEFFHCFDLGVQLKPVIQAYFASEQHKSGKPLPDTITEASKAPVQPNYDIDAPKPVNIAQWIAANAERIASSSSGFGPLSDVGEFKVIFFAGKNSSDIRHQHTDGEAWIWQFEGSCELFLDGSPDAVSLSKGDCFLIQQGVTYQMRRPDNSQGFVIRMVPKM